jgi:hypothetical protein
LCIGCGELLEFTEDMSLVVMSQDTLDALGEDGQLDELLYHQNYVRNVRGVLQDSGPMH